MRVKTLISVLSDYGIAWAFYRSLYVVKLTLLRHVPIIERIFEHDKTVIRVDAFSHAIDFAGVQDLLHSLSQDERNQIVERADKAARGVIEAFSSLELDYGHPIQWFLNPMNGERVPSDIKWFLIPDFDERFGDIKVFWEVSRFSQAILFARAALLTNDERYHQAFSDQLHSWLCENRYSLGSNYKCGQENALRLFNVLIAYSAFSYLGMTTPRDKQDVVELVGNSYRRIRANFFYANKCIRNNHTLSELCGLVIGSWCCGEADLTKKYHSMFEKELLRQFLVDGGYIQWSFNYQRFALQLVEMMYCLQGVIGFSLSSETQNRVARSAKLLYQMQLPNGELPNYGSNDGALIFPLSTCGFRDYRPLIACLLRQFDEGSPYEQGPWDEESAWFSGHKLLSKYTEIAHASSAFNEAGLFSLRGGDILVNVMLQDFKSHRPAHMDQLHVDISVGRKNVLCDGGTFSYASDLGDRLVRTRSHNTAAVVGLDQMGKSGQFLLYDWTKRQKACHDAREFIGSYRTKAGYIHERHVELDEMNDVVITDKVVFSNKQSGFEVVFHSPCCVYQSGSSVRLFDDDGLVGTIIFSKQCLIDLSIEEYEFSPLYMRRMQGVQIVARYSEEIGSSEVKTVFRRVNATGSEVACE